MGFKSITVDQDVSILRMLRLDDTDNILISRLDSLWKYHDMLLARLTNADKTDVKIHLRANLLNADVGRYLSYLRDGAQLMLWQDTPKTGRKLDNLTLVHMQQVPRARQEGFLVIRTPASSRILAAWKDADDNVAGVLVTNPKTVEKISDQLDAIIRSAAR